MLTNRHERTDLFALVPQLGLRFEPQLKLLERLLDDDELFRAVPGGLAPRRPATVTRGRPSTPVEVILRMLVVMRLYAWSYAQAEYFVNDSLVLRQFCRVYLHKVPDDTTLIRWAYTIGPATIARLNERVIHLARSLRSLAAASSASTRPPSRPISTSPPPAAAVELHDEAGERQGQTLGKCRR